MSTHGRPLSALRVDERPLTITPRGTQWTIFSYPSVTQETIWLPINRTTPWVSPKRLKVVVGWARQALRLGNLDGPRGLNYLRHIVSNWVAKRDTAGGGASNGVANVLLHNADGVAGGHQGNDNIDDLEELMEGVESELGEVQGMAADDVPPQPAEADEPAEANELAEEGESGDDKPQLAVGDWFHYKSPEFNNYLGRGYTFVEPYTDGIHLVYKKKGTTKYHLVPNRKKTLNEKISAQIGEMARRSTYLLPGYIPSSASGSSSHSSSVVASPPPTPPPVSGSTSPTQARQGRSPQHSPVGLLPLPRPSPPTPPTQQPPSSPSAAPIALLAPRRPPAMQPPPTSAAEKPSSSRPAAAAWLSAALPAPPAAAAASSGASAAPIALLAPRQPPAMQPPPTSAAEQPSSSRPAAAAWPSAALPAPPAAAAATPQLHEEDPHTTILRLQEELRLSRMAAPGARNVMPATRTAVFALEAFCTTLIDTLATSKSTWERVLLSAPNRALLFHPRTLGSHTLVVCLRYWVATAPGAVDHAGNKLLTRLIEREHLADIPGTEEHRDGHVSATLVAEATNASVWKEALPRTQAQVRTSLAHASLAHTSRACASLARASLACASQPRTRLPRTRLPRTRLPASHTPSSHTPPSHTPPSHPGGGGLAQHAPLQRKLLAPGSGVGPSPAPD